MLSNCDNDNPVFEQTNIEDNSNNNKETLIGQVDKKNNSNNYGNSVPQLVLEQVYQENILNCTDDNDQLIIKQVYKENEAYITGEMQIEHKEYSDNIQEVEGAAKMDNQSYDSCGGALSLEQEEQTSKQQTVHDILSQPHVQQEQGNLNETSNQQTMQEILNQSQIQQEQNAIDETSNQQTVQDILNQPHVQQEQCNLDEIANQQTIQEILNQSQVQQEQNVQDILSQSQIQQEDSDDKTLIVLFKKKRCIIMPKSYYKQYQDDEYSYSSDNNE